MHNVDDELEAFLRAARMPFADAEEGKQAMLTRLEATLGSLGPPPSPSPAPPAPPRAAVDRRSSSASKRVPVLRGWRAASFVAGGFAMGVAAHAAYDASRARKPSPLVATVASQRTDVTEARVTPPTPSRPSTWVPAEVAPTPMGPLSSVPVPLAASPEPRGDLPRERVLLEAARTALERGDPAHALTALDRHRSRFPEGQLREERETLEVYALVAAGRADEARAKTRSFHRAFPMSLQGAALDALLDSLH